MSKQYETNEDSPLNPLDSARFVIERARNVSIDRSKIVLLSKQISDSMINGLAFNDDDQWIESDVGPPKNQSIQFILDWIFFVTTLNFSFWLDQSSINDDNDSYTKIYKTKVYFGYEALCAAVNQAIDNGINLIDAQFYSKVSLEQLEQIFNSSNKIESKLPMLKERQQILNQTGKIILQKFNGHFENCLKQCGNNAIDIVRFIVETFPSYQDETFYDGQKVSFYKRAQILVADIWGVFKGRSIGHFIDLDHLTMFADYRVPQVLSHEGILIYSNRLKERISKGEIIPFGDKDEVEIRAGSILSIDLIVNQVNENIPFERDIGDEGQRINAILVDVFLWRRRRTMKDQYKITPFHRTRSIFY